MTWAINYTDDQVQDEQEMVVKSLDGLRPPSSVQKNSIEYVVLFTLIYFLSLFTNVNAFDFGSLVSLPSLFVTVVKQPSSFYIWLL